MRQSDWITVSEASRRLGVDRTVIDRLVEAGHLGVRRIPGALVRVQASDIDELLRESVTRKRA